MMAVKISRFRKLGVLIVVSLLLLNVLFVFKIVPSAFADDTNLAPAWSGWSLTYGTPPYIVFEDSSVLAPSGANSLRLERHTTADNNTGREINTKTWLAVSPGDTVLFQVYAKTETYTSTYETGARIGIDFYGDGVMDAQPHALYQVSGVWYSRGDANWIYPDGWDEVNFQTFEDVPTTDFICPWGTSTWTLLEWNVTVPDKVYERTMAGDAITPQQISGMIAFLDARPTTANADVWFGDPILYRNPSGETPESPGGGAEVLAVEQATAGAATYTTIVEGSAFHKEAGQTFTVGASNLTLTVVSANLSIFNTQQDLIFDVYAVSGGLPTGSILSTGTIEAGDFVDDTWHNCSMSPVTLNAGTEYALCASSPTADGTNFIAWYYASGNPYAGGTWLNSTDSGSTWTADSDKDMAFRIYGTEPSSFTYTSQVTINTPLNSTYTSTTVPFDISVDGNDTITDYQLNAYYANGTAVGSNQTSASGFFTNLANGTYTFACYIEGTEGSSDYDTRVFTVSTTPEGDYIRVTPSSSTIAAGDTVNYTVSVYNTYGAYIEDATGDASFSITSGAGGSWSNSTYTSDGEGTWIVTASYNEMYAYANLIVTPVSTVAVLQLPFDSETSSTCVDWSGHSNHGAISGATRSYAGYYGMGLSFDGDDYVTVVDDSTLDLTSYVLLSARIKPTSVSDAVIIDKPGAYGVYLTSNGGVSFRLNEYYYNITGELAGITAGNWYYISCRYDSSEPTYKTRITVNHVSWTATFSDPFPESITASADDVIIGDEFNGLVDEVQVFSTSSTPHLSVAYYPYNYDFGVSSSSNWLTQDVSYNFTGSYIRENSTSYLTDAAYSFSDGSNDMGLNWTSTDGTIANGAFTQTTASGKIVFLLQSATLSDNALILASTIEITSSVQGALSVDIIMSCTDAEDDTSTRVMANMFSIYGVGSVSTVTTVGDGSQVAGGSIFDVMATDSSLTGSGSSAKVSTLVSNFQHFHTLVSLYQGAIWVDDPGVWDAPTYCFETGHLSYGVDYYDSVNNDTVDGWYVEIKVISGAAGDYNEDQNADAYVELLCDWYNNGELIKSDPIFVGYEAYRENDTTTQFSLFVDLWLSNQNGNSMVGGQVSAQYYGLTENGWWLWQNWGPVEGLQTSSTFYDYLYDSESDIITASELELFHVWTEVAKTSEGTGPTSDDEHVWASTNKNLQFFSLPSGVTLVGINTPIMNPTTTPDMPVGFFAEMGNLFANAIASLSYYMSTFAASAAGVTSSALNSAFSALGVTEAVTSITSFGSAIGVYFASSVTYITDLLYTFFTLFTSIASFLIEWFGNFVGMIITIGDTVVTILNGTNSITGALGEVWSFFPTEPTFWTLFIPLILVVYWFDSIDKRAKQYGGGWMGTFMGDIQNIISVFSFIIDLSWRVVSTVIDLSMRFFNILV